MKEKDRKNKKDVKVVPLHSNLKEGINQVEIEPCDVSNGLEKVYQNLNELDNIIDVSLRKDNSRR